jgi:pimeloyl-ACP methyl ester carboxylesterase
MPFIPFKNGRIRYSDTGTGRAVVLLHGFLENRTMWNDFTPALSKGKRVVAIDLPGHGDSDCFGYVHSMELMAEAVMAVLDTLKLRKVVLVGHSMGGYVALALAELNPDRVKGLCLFFSTAHADSAERKAGRDQSIALVKQNHKSFIRVAVPLLFRPKNRKLHRDAVNALKKEALKTPKQGVIAALEGMKLRPDREVILRFCPYPVHFVIGKQDPVLPYESLLAQAEASDQASVTFLPDCGHMGFIEERDASLKALKKFIIQCFR